VSNPKKSLGQHWLFDEPTLKAIISAAEVTQNDTVLEVGPGLGTLTELLAARAKEVVAVEKDERLSADLKRKLSVDNLEIVVADIRQFNLSNLPVGYKVVANIPYYLTSYLLRQLLEAANPPTVMSLLVQKEVAERVTAGPGEMSLLAFSVQYFGQPSLLREVPKELFEPAPKVDSAILKIKLRPRPYFEADTRMLFRLVKAGFGERRKQLKNSLSGGLGLDTNKLEMLLKGLRISHKVRAQELSLDDWQRLYKEVVSKRLIA